MKIELSKAVPDRKKSPIYVVFVPKDGVLEPYDVRDSWALRALEKEGFKGDLGEIAVVTSPEAETPRYVCVGVGEVAGVTMRVWRTQLATALRVLQKKKFDTYSVCIPQWLQFDIAELIRFSVITSYDATYQFSSYITDVERHLLLPKKITFVVGDVFKKKALLEAALNEGSIVGQAIVRVRELGNMPPVDMTPAQLAKEAQVGAKKLKKLTCTVLGPKELKKEGMGGLLAVSAGSGQDAQFIILEYRGAAKSSAPLVFAGKAVTFDAGGLSVKPAAKLDEMKFDMLGGAAVIGAVTAIAELQLPINVVGLVGATENLLGDDAYRPGDIVKTHSGKTIEILNTDAEGRVVLADALSYAKKYKPQLVVDLATLTGACVVALGTEYGAVFSRSDEQVSLLTKAAAFVDEQLWRLPIDDDFKKQMQSQIADVRNIGSSSYGGASLGAAFLEYFVDFPWAHMDIAGVAYGDEKPFRAAGATGYGVQTLVALAHQLSKKS